MGGLASDIFIGGNLFIISVKSIFELLLNLGVFWSRTITNFFVPLYVIEVLSILFVFNFSSYFILSISIFLDSLVLFKYLTLILKSGVF